MWELMGSMKNRTNLGLYMFGLPLWIHLEEKTAKVVKQDRWNRCIAGNEGQVEVHYAACVGVSKNEANDA